MPKVEWADASAVSRSAPALRDKPEPAGDPFAAIFDSARRGTASRIDQAARQGQSADVRENRPASKKEKPAPQEREKEQKRLKDSTRPTAPPSSVDARQSEKVEKEEGVEPRPEAEQPSQADAAGDPSTTAEQAEAQGVPQQATQESELSAQAETGEAPEGEIEPTSLEAADKAAGEAQLEPSTAPAFSPRFWPPAPQAGEPESPSAPAEAPVPGLPEAPTAASPLAAMVPDLLAPCEGSTGEPGQSGAPQAANSSSATAPTASSDAASQLTSDQTAAPSSEKPLSVWQFLRGVAAHLEQVMATQAQRQANSPALPAEAAERNPAAEVSAARPPATQVATALQVAGLDDAGAALQQNQDEDGTPSGDDGTAGSESPGKAARPWEASAHQTGATDDFRNLIEVSSRIRDQIMSPDLQSGTTLIGREPSGKGVNLNEARAMTDLADVVRANIGARHSSMVLRLDPPELGQVRIDVRMHGDELSLRLQADTLVGRDALTSRLNDLRSSLEQHGFKLNQMEVELRVPQGSQPQPHQDGSTRQQGAWDGQAWQGPGWQGHAGGGGATSSGSESSNEGSAFSQENASSGEEIDWVQGPAETGVDLVV